MTGARDLAWSETLRNGLAVTFRSLRPDDRERIANAIRELGPESIYTRLFSHRTELTEAALDRITAIDPARDVALLATIASGRYMSRLLPWNSAFSFTRNWERSTRSHRVNRH